MKSTIIAGSFIFFLLVTAHGQSVTKSHDLTSPAAVVRIKALQNQVERQQIEIDALRNRLGNLQQKFQELAEIIADQNKASDDDDSDDDASDVTFLRVHSRSRNAGGHTMNLSKPVRSGERPSDRQSRAPLIGFHHSASDNCVAPFRSRQPLAGKDSTE